MSKFIQLVAFAITLIIVTVATAQVPPPQTNLSCVLTQNGPPRSGLMQVNYAWQTTAAGGKFVAQSDTYLVTPNAPPAVGNTLTWAAGQVNNPAGPAGNANYKVFGVPGATYVSYSKLAQNGVIIGVAASNNVAAP